FQYSTTEALRRGGSPRQTTDCCISWPNSLCPRRGHPNLPNQCHTWTVIAAQLGVELGRRTSLLYRHPSSTGKFDGLIRLPFLLALRAGQPKIAHSVDLASANQLLLLGPIKRRKEFLSPKASLLFRRAISRGAGIEGLPHQLLIHHPHQRPIRGNRQIHPLV